MLYPQCFIDDLKNRADIVRIIQPYAELKKKASNLIARSSFCILVQVLLSSASFAQAQHAQAVQVDAFGKATCEELLSRTQNFYLDLINNPATVGAVVISPDEKSIKDALYYKNAIQAIWVFWKFDVSR